MIAVGALLARVSLNGWWANHTDTLPDTDTDELLAMWSEMVALTAEAEKARDALAAELGHRGFPSFQDTAA